MLRACRGAFSGLLVINMNSWNEAAVFNKERLVLLANQQAWCSPLLPVWPRYNPPTRGAVSLKQEAAGIVCGEELKGHGSTCTDRTILIK